MKTHNLIVHLSDPHFGTENREVMPALVRAVSELSPELIIVSGDLTQRGRRSQFQRVKEFLLRLPAVPKLAVPGNHDIPLFNLLLRFTNPYRNYHECFPEREGVITADNLIVAGFDATTPFLHIKGKLTIEESRAKLKHLCADRSSSQLLGLVIHHPIVVERNSDIKNLLIHSSELCELFSEFKVDFVMSGHIHLPSICSVKELHPSLSWGTLFSGAGTAVSHRTRDGIPNSFNSLIVGTSGNEVIIQRHDFAARSGGFGVVSSQNYSRSSAGWSSSSGQS